MRDPNNFHFNILLHYCWTFLLNNLFKLIYNVFAICKISWDDHIRFKYQKYIAYELVLGLSFKTLYCSNFMHCLKTKLILWLNLVLSFRDWYFQKNILELLMKSVRNIYLYVHEKNRTNNFTFKIFSNIDLKKTFCNT